MTTADATMALIRDASRTVWDVIVIGAGPAGTTVARQSAKSGLRTLLVDAKQFPREKVCGGYLNSRALEVLRKTRLAGTIAAGFEPAIQELDLVYGRRSAHFSLPPGKVICRTTFDAALVEAAQNAGTTVLTGVQACVEPTDGPDARDVSLSFNGTRKTIRSRVVVCADGLSRMSVRYLPEFTSAIAPGSRVGIGAVVADSGDTFRCGRITMAISRQGYVGISRIDPSQLNVAAAVEPTLLSNAAPVEVVASILADSDIVAPLGLRCATWRGTPALTSRPQRVAANRVFLIGDAGGYVEPFTGEGMATALESAMAVTPLVLQAAQAWAPATACRWESLHRQIVSDRQHTCRTLAWILRRPWATYATLSTCRVLPGVATRWIAKTNLSPNVGMYSTVGTT